MCVCERERERRNVCVCVCFHARECVRCEKECVGPKFMEWKLIAVGFQVFVIQLVVGVKI